MPNRISAKRARIRNGRRHGALQGFTDVQSDSKYATLIETIGSQIKPTSQGCWLWTGTTDANGYGVYSGVRIHRFVYETLSGPIPRRHVVHHTCCVRKCCNPEHLVPMTNSEHTQLHADQRRNHAA